MSKGIPGVKHYATKVMKYERGGTVGSVDDRDEDMRQSAMAEMARRESPEDRDYLGLPVRVTDRNGRTDVLETGRMSANNFSEGAAQKVGSDYSAKARAKKNKKDD